MEKRIMQKRRLGRTNLKASVIGFGGIPIIRATMPKAVEMIRRGYDLGINYFDTARAYGNSEEKFGSALEEVRDNVIIATKTHQRTREDAARAGLRQSLQKLRTDKIDIVLLHGIDDEKTLEQAMAARKTGLHRNLGTQRIRPIQSHTNRRIRHNSGSIQYCEPRCSRWASASSQRT
jgi:aryl-alcohol dehydrogenase-like predicted oxidoreductase